MTEEVQETSQEPATVEPEKVDGRGQHNKRKGLWGVNAPIVPPPIVEHDQLAMMRHVLDRPAREDVPGHKVYRRWLGKDVRGFMKVKAELEVLSLPGGVVAPVEEADEGSEKVLELVEKILEERSWAK